MFAIIGLQLVYGKHLETGHNPEATFKNEFSVLWVGLQIPIVLLMRPSENNRILAT